MGLRRPSSRAAASTVGQLGGVPDTSADAFEVVEVGAGTTGGGSPSAASARAIGSDCGGAGETGPAAGLAQPRHTHSAGQIAVRTPQGIARREGRATRRRIDLPSPGVASGAEIWRRYDAIEAELSAPLTARMLELAALAPGMRVLDLATGRGEPAIAAARRVAPHGSVIGLDPDASMLAMTRERADREHVTNLALHAMPAEALATVAGAPFEVVTCRWGLMYMRDPVVVLDAIRSALARDGVLVAALWAEPARVDWHQWPRRLLPGGAPAIDRAVPGPFSFAELPHIVATFTRAGLAIDHVEERYVPVFTSTEADDVVAWTRAFGLAPLLAELSAIEQQHWTEAFTAELERSRRDDRLVLGGVTRIVRARGA